MVVSRSRITIDLDNLCHNVNYLKSNNNEKILCAVVKANAYGHGINIVAKKLLNLGVQWFAVSSVNEGIELRKIIGNSNCILIFPDFYANRWEEIERYNLIPVIHNFRSLDELAGSRRSHLKFHIEIDTGMSRTGFNSKDLPKLVSKLKGLHLDGLEGVYSHLASSEENNKAYTTKQIN